MGRARASLAALETALRCNTIGVEVTDADREALRGWSGWGPLAKAFDTEPRGSWAEMQGQLLGLLSPQDYQEGFAAIPNAFYTPPELAEQMHALLRALGFPGGRVGEFGCGQGVFFDQAPPDVPIDWIGVEKDPSTALIASLRHPTATIKNSALEETRLPPLDAVIGNVPFEDTPIHDPNPNVPDAVKSSLHLYSTWRAVDELRPGGVAIVISSRYLLDNESAAGRVALARQADLLGAIRLPNNALSSAGTEALVDILVLRKRLPHEPVPEKVADAPWVQSAPHPELGQRVNRVFLNHPEWILGTLSEDRGYAYGRTLRVDLGDEKDLLTELRRASSDIAGRAQEAGRTWQVPRRDADAALADVVLRDADGRKEGSFHILEDGRAYQVRAGVLAPVMVKDHKATKEATEAAQQAAKARGEDPKSVEEVRVDKGPLAGKALRELAALCELRDVTLELLEAEADHTRPDEDLMPLRQRLGECYDAYVGEFGFINRATITVSQSPPKNTPAPPGERDSEDDEDSADEQTGLAKVTRKRPTMGGFPADPDYPAVLALENFDDAANTGVKAPIFHRRVNVPRPRIEHAESPEHAVAISLDETGGIDLDRIGELLDVPGEQVTAALGDLVYEDPLTVTWVPREEYLSDDVVTKLEQARAAAEHQPQRYARNVAALEAAQPTPLTPDEITFALGAPYIPTEVIEDFCEDVLGERVEVEFTPELVQWDVVARSAERSVAATSQWGTSRIDGLELVQYALNGRAPVIKDPPATPEDKPVTNQAETQAARAKQSEIAAEFSEWSKKDPVRADWLASIYNDRFCRYVPRQFSGAHLTVNGLDPGFDPYSHQREMVHRMISQPTALCGHDVGAGKTATMFMAAMKLRELGLVRKPLIIVPNHLLEQVARDGKRFFPGANILMADERQLGKRTDKVQRKLFAARCATQDHDVVVMTHTAFESIPVTPSTQADFLAEHTADLQAALLAHGSSKSKKPKALSKALKRETAVLKDHINNERADAGVTFEMLGVDYLMVDEAHYFKNLHLRASDREISLPKGSNRATDLDNKLAYLRRTSDSGRIGTLFTGTPLSNNLVEVYVMQHYLQPERLQAMGVDHLDAWLLTFVRVEDRMEVATDGVSFRMKRRPVAYRNAPELMSAFNAVADVRSKKQLGLKTPDARFENVVTPATGAQTRFIAEIGDRIDRLPTVSRDMDNMLWICGDGRKAAIDMSLVGVDDPEDGKVAAVVSRMAETYHRTKDRTWPNGRTGSLQLGFLDLGTPHPDKGDQVYGLIRTGLIRHGVPGDKIRYIHEAKTNAQKATLFAQCRSGEVAVLLGSTDKMGVGTNVQDLLVRMHHVDPPWRPADVAQRDGRGLRVGNQMLELGEPVEVTKYITQGSFDSYMWQTLERKAWFIAQLFGGSPTREEVEIDLDDTVLQMHEAKALATGNPLLLQQAEVKQEVTRLQRMATSHARTQKALDNNIATWREQKTALQARVRTYQDLARTAAASDQQWRFGNTAVAKDKVNETLGGVLQRMMGGRSAYHDPLEYRGIRVTIRARQELATWRLEAQLGGKESVALKKEWVAAAGQYWRITRAITQAIDHADDQVAELHTAIDDLDARITEGLAQVGQPFPQAAELAQARARLDSIETAIENGDPPPPEPADADADADSLHDPELAAMVAHDAAAMVAASGGTVQAFVVTHAGPVNVQDSPQSTVRAAEVELEKFSIELGDLVDYYIELPETDKVALGRHLRALFDHPELAEEAAHCRATGAGVDGYGQDLEIRLAEMFTTSLVDQPYGESAELGRIGLNDAFRAELAELVRQYSYRYFEFTAQAPTEDRDATAVVVDGEVQHTTGKTDAQPGQDTPTTHGRDNDPVDPSVLRSAPGTDEDTAEHDPVAADTDRSDDDSDAAEPAPENPAEPTRPPAGDPEVQPAGAQPGAVDDDTQTQETDTVGQQSSHDTPQSSAEDGETAQPTGGLVIEHGPSGTIVRGTTEEDTALHAILRKNRFRFSSNKGFWYLTRRMRHDTRSGWVNRLQADLNRAGREFRVQQPAPRTEPDTVSIPAGEPYTDHEQILADYDATYSAYLGAITSDTGRRLMNRYYGDRPDGQAVEHAGDQMILSGRALEGSPQEVAARYAAVARASRTFAANLAEERYRAPKFLDSLTTLVETSMRLASRLQATVDADAATQLIADAHAALQAPVAAPVSNAGQQISLADLDAPDDAADQSSITDDSDDEMPAAETATVVLDSTTTEDPAEVDDAQDAALDTSDQSETNVAEHKRTNAPQTDAQHGSADPEPEAGPVNSRNTTEAEQDPRHREDTTAGSAVTDDAGQVNSGDDESETTQEHQPGAAPSAEESSPQQAELVSASSTELLAALFTEGTKQRAAEEFSRRWQRARGGHRPPFAEVDDPESPGPDFDAIDQGADLLLELSRFITVGAYHRVGVRPGEAVDEETASRLVAAAGVDPESDQAENPLRAEIVELLCGDPLTVLHECRRLGGTMRDELVLRCVALAGAAWEELDEPARRELHVTAQHADFTDRVSTVSDQVFASGYLTSTLRQFVPAQRQLARAAFDRIPEQAVQDAHAALDVGHRAVAVQRFATGFDGAVLDRRDPDRHARAAFVRVLAGINDRTTRLEFTQTRWQDGAFLERMSALALIAGYASEFQQRCQGTDSLARLLRRLEAPERIAALHRIPAEETPVTQPPPVQDYRYLAAVLHAAETEPTGAAPEATVTVDETPAATEETTGTPAAEDPTPRPPLPIRQPGKAIEGSLWRLTPRDEQDQTGEHEPTTAPTTQLPQRNASESENTPPANRDGQPPLTNLDRAPTASRPPALLHLSREHGLMLLGPVDGHDIEALLQDQPDSATTIGTWEQVRPDAWRAVGTQGQPHTAAIFHQAREVLTRLGNDDLIDIHFFVDAERDDAAQEALRWFVRNTHNHEIHFVDSPSEPASTTRVPAPEPAHTQASAPRPTDTTQPEHLDWPTEDPDHTDTAGPEDAQRDREPAGVDPVQETDSASNQPRETAGRTAEPVHTEPADTRPAARGPRSPVPMDDPHAAALAWHDAGFSVIPVKTDGTKAPIVGWAQYQRRRASREQVSAWFRGGHAGIGLVCGTVSGDVELVEFEGRALDEGVFDQWRETMLAGGHEELFRTVTEHGLVVRSPSGGLHLFIRVDMENGVGGNEKLARRYAREEEWDAEERARFQQRGTRPVRVLAETRGERGMVVAAGSHGGTHPSGRGWEIVRGEPTSVPVLTPHERDIIHNTIKTLDQLPPPAPISAPAPSARPQQQDDALTPGQDFNNRASWSDVLEPHGWVAVRQQADRTEWRRPGKQDPGISAVTGGGGHDYLWVFSTSTELPSETALSKFRAYTLLNYGNRPSDFSAAARELRRNGYGGTTQPTSAPRRLLLTWRPDVGALLLGTQPDDNIGELFQEIRRAGRNPGRWSWERVSTPDGERMAWRLAGTQDTLPSLTMLTRLGITLDALEQAKHRVDLDIPSRAFYGIPTQRSPLAQQVVDRIRHGSQSETQPGTAQTTPTSDTGSARPDTDDAVIWPTTDPAPSEPEEIPKMTSISPQILADYLRGTGWQEIGQHSDNATLWARSNGEHESQLLVPNYPQRPSEPRIRGYERRLRDALLVLHDTEGRVSDHAGLVDDILHAAEPQWPTYDAPDGASATSVSTATPAAPSPAATPPPAGGAGEPAEATGSTQQRVASEQDVVFPTTDPELPHQTSATLDAEQVFPQREIVLHHSQDYGLMLYGTRSDDAVREILHIARLQGHAVGHWYWNPAAVTPDGKPGAWCIPDSTGRIATPVTVKTLRAAARALQVTGVAVQIDIAPEDATDEAQQAFAEPDDSSQRSEAPVARRWSASDRGQWQAANKRTEWAGATRVDAAHLGGRWALRAQTTVRGHHVDLLINLRDQERMEDLARTLLAKPQQIPKLAANTTILGDADAWIDGRVLPRTETKPTLQAWLAEPAAPHGQTQGNGGRTTTASRQAAHAVTISAAAPGTRNWSRPATGSGTIRQPAMATGQPAQSAYRRTM